MTPSPPGRGRLGWGEKQEECLEMLCSCWSRRSASPVLVLFLLLLAYGWGGDVYAKKAAYLQKGEAYVTQDKYTALVIQISNALTLDPNEPEASYESTLPYLKQCELHL